MEKNVPAKNFFLNDCEITAVLHAIVQLCKRYDESKDEAFMSPALNVLLKLCEELHSREDAESRLLASIAMAVAARWCDLQDAKEREGENGQRNE